MFDGIQVRLAFVRAGALTQQAGHARDPVDRGPYFVTDVCEELLFRFLKLYKLLSITLSLRDVATVQDKARKIVAVLKIDRIEFEEAV